jgi:hypothetical protein
MLSVGDRSVSQGSRGAQILMGDWCGSANDLQTSKIEVADAEKGSEESELASECHPAKNSVF